MSSFNSSYEKVRHMKDLVELIQPLDSIQLNLLKQSKLYLASENKPSGWDWEELQIGKGWFIPKEG